MHRVDTKGHIEIHGKKMFFDGDPHGDVNQNGTELGQDWLNDVQENLALFIESMGISLVKGDYSQLSSAVTIASQGNFDFICREKNDLQQVLREKQRANLKIRVDVNQEIQDEIEINHENIFIEGKWGIKLFNAIPEQDYQTSCFTVKKDGIFLSYLQFEKFRYAANFSEAKVNLAVLNNCVIYKNSEESDFFIGDAGHGFIYHTSVSLKI